MRTFNFYVDRGHGWLAVKKHLLAELDLLDKISPYATTRLHTVYLDEEIDAPLFLKTWKERYGEEPHLVEVPAVLDRRRNRVRYHFGD